MSRNSATDYFSHLKSCGSDDESYTYADVAKHFSVAPGTVRSSLINYIAKNGLSDFMWMVERKPESASTGRSSTAFSPEMIEFATTASSLRVMLEAFPSQPKSRVARCYRMHRQDPDRGRSGRQAFELWRAAVDAGQPVDWSAINKVVGERSPAHVSVLVANEAKRRGVDGPVVHEAKTNFKATDEQKALLGTRLDSDLASEWGVTTGVVAALRRRLDIPAPVRVAAAPDYSGEAGKAAYDAVVASGSFVRAALTSGLNLTTAQIRDAARGYAAAHGLSTDGLGAKTGRRKS